MSACQSTGRHRGDCPGRDAWQNNGPQQGPPLKSHDLPQLASHPSGMHAPKHATWPLGHAIWQSPPVQVWPASQVPQLPPQPSLPQDLLAQFGTQTAWQAPTVAPSRNSFFRACLETFTVCPDWQSVTLLLRRGLAAASCGSNRASAAGMANPISARVSRLRRDAPPASERAQRSKRVSSMTRPFSLASGGPAPGPHSSLPRGRSSSRGIAVVNTESRKT